MNFARKIYSILIDLVETLVIAGAIFVVIYAFLFRPFQVNGQSMFPNYHNGEYILTNLISLRFQELQRGDVVVFKAPTNQEKDYIKRVIGLPEETVSLKEGKIFINDKQLSEKYLPSDFKTYEGTFLQEGQSVSVPDKSYFVLGDNRDFSSDSREWGFVTKDKIIGKSFIVYWPIADFKIVQRGQYGGVN
ncbi:MAG: signal peptidase I [Candidatus Levybacteria bacterium CG_4_10_14_0_2_um_filter_36_16]|nr:MAG: signal peptidase I [Candidatus Levybacteria bacterium CG2_30_37_29]PIR79146.1 MAG: signal peptidase I [Candidatus Levybacteria bacterium CG10_big_fil_rev_8_21_14_0_10_36_30]PIZ96778.1 MAG: signal peptidase I [Candidatus Levybacteria bacterium CG_4_10_14_0_2_um_filter_36_16]PJA90666.1 MAG: signal peptidase I [Candidatus Levybacteria bacterium CG_4_9_14_3_um_filter_36_7]